MSVGEAGTERVGKLLAGEAKPLEREFWRRRDVDVQELPLEAYIETLMGYAGLGVVEMSA